MTFVTLPRSSAPWTMDATNISATTKRTDKTSPVGGEDVSWTVYCNGGGSQRSERGDRRPKSDRNVLPTHKSIGEDARPLPIFAGFADVEARSLTPALQLAHLGQELAVGCGFRETLDQQFHRFNGGQRVQHLSQYPDALQIVLGNQQLFFTRTGALNIDCREGALID